MATSNNTKLRREMMQNVRPLATHSTITMAASNNTELRCEMMQN
ncbi:hypothetical protein A2U01_0077792, partial [Trifolium medium]|nr:hypothetical protein [Trifolium medium]